MWEVIAGIVGIITLGIILYDRNKKKIKSSLRRCYGRFLCECLGRHRWSDRTYRSGEVDLANDDVPNRVCLRCGLRSRLKILLGLLFGLSTGLGVKRFS